MNAQSAQIECTDLVRIFSAEGVEVQALQGLTLRVDRGELTAIVGASGSGKSTLLTILSGLDVPSAGSARVAGHDLLAMGSRERTAYRRHTVGFVWQQTSRNLLPYLTAAENVAMALAVARSPRRRRTGRVDELLDLLGVASVRDRPPAQMSGGQQQRVAIAVALANAPEVLFADEPTGELDEVSSQGVFDALRDVNERLGVTVLIVTHDQRVSQQVRRTVQIRDGRLYSDQESPRSIRYIANLTDPDDWNALFTEVVAAALALKIAHPLTHKAGMIEIAQRAYDRALERAMAVNAIERRGFLYEAGWDRQRGDNRYWRA